MFVRSARKANNNVRNCFWFLLRRRKTHNTLREMLRGLETQLTMRCLKPSVLASAPLLRCLLYRLQELQGERRHGDERSFVRTLKAVSSEFEETSAQSMRGHAHTEDAGGGGVRSRAGRSSSSLVGNESSAKTSHAGSLTSLYKSTQIARSRTLLIPKIEC